MLLGGKKKKQGSAGSLEEMKICSRIGALLEIARKLWAGSGVTVLFTSELKLSDMPALVRSRLCDLEIELGALSPKDRMLIL